MASDRVVEKIEESYKDSFKTWQELDRANDDEDYDEDYETTLARKWEEGYSDALAMVLNLLKEEGK